MNTKRLRLMITMLEEIEQRPPTESHKKFDMDIWNCGTSACAVGFAMADKRFHGLAMKPIITGSLHMTPVYGDLEGVKAVADYFGITATEVDWLFTSEHYEADAYNCFNSYIKLDKNDHPIIKPRHVAAYIHNFIEAGGIPE